MATKTSERYIEAVGRRKTSVARVRITPASKQSFLVNDKSLGDFFQLPALIKKAEDSFAEAEIDQKFAVTVHVNGGGIAAQAESVRLGIARCLVKYNADLRKPLKKLGFLKRDQRSVERKKPGLKKARKAPQWSKR